jgi:hypothetical protein
MPIENLSSRRTGDARQGQGYMILSSEPSLAEHQKMLFWYENKENGFVIFRGVNLREGKGKSKGFKSRI